MPDRGQVLLNGTPGSEFMLRDRKSRIRLMARDHGLLQGSILENMTWFQPELYRDRAFALAEEIGVADVLAQAPGGYEVRTLSNGQNHLPRSVAEALLVVGALSSDPDVVLIDDIGASFDLDTDRRFIEMMRAWRPSRITVLVSNRPSRLAVANRHLDLAPFLSTSDELLAEAV